jgi:hypothetical protein
MAAADLTVEHAPLAVGELQIQLFQAQRAGLVLGHAMDHGQLAAHAASLLPRAAAVDIMGACESIISREC